MRWLAAALLLLTTPAAAQTLDYTPPPVGTVSTYQFQSFTQQETIVGVEGDLVQVEAGGSAGILFRGFLTVATGDRTFEYDRALVASLWPLEAGKQLAYDFTYRESSGAWPGKAELTVVGFQDLIVPAGSFETVLITYRSTLDRAGQISTATASYWLDVRTGLPVVSEFASPQIGTPIRLELTERR